MIKPKVISSFLTRSLQNRAIPRIRSRELSTVEEGVCPVRRRGILRMRTSALFGEKLLIFEIYDESAQTRGGGWADADVLRTGGKGQFFAILFGRLLWTVLQDKRLKRIPYGIFTIC